MNMTVLPGLADDGSGPVFASPWQAQIFSLVVGLHESGCFSWNEWAEALSREIAEDSSGGADGVMTLGQHAGTDFGAQNHPGFG